MTTAHRVLQASRGWKWVPPGAELLRVGEVEVIAYPEWARMNFYAMPERVADPEETVTAVCDAARSRGRTTTEWWVAPYVDGDPLVETLLRRGATTTEVSEILACDLSAGLPDIPVPDDVRTMRVSDARTLDDAERVTAVVWGGDPSSGERRAEQVRVAEGPLDVSEGFRVVAYAEGEPFATAGCQVVDGVARLWSGCVLPEWRGRGGYRATLRARLAIARDNGAGLALVHARVGTSKPILTRLGFASYGEGRLYTLPLEGPGSGPASVAP